MPEPGGATEAAEANRPLRVMTWNLHALGTPWLTTRRCVDAVVGVLRDTAPDVVGVQERPLGPLGRWRLRRVAGRAGLRVVVGGGASRSTALLVRADLPSDQAAAYRLPWELPRTRRGASTARVLPGGEPVRVVVIHLGLDAGERERHLRLVLDRLPRTDPLVVLGDLNELPDQPSWRTLLDEELTDAAAQAGPTFPASAPAQRIDAVLVGPTSPPSAPAQGVDAAPVGYRLRVTAARVLDVPAARVASDHLPVVVDLVVGEER
ncbi:endonuclease/exonuclease/phosphatase family protein [Cellulomonas sp. SG140]|uniref:endonuclease/exonuclease/phosphatase family protein n=1 Tax=Cellulomonas sp. SG140 TaxID=2976536 RepID=UPI0021E94D40|nr:endonuclease/exonuclease/phosphatase family protein [Cellulomonas sp. SG140]